MGTMGDADIVNSKSWDTDVFGFLSGWSGLSIQKRTYRMKSLLFAFAFPVLGLRNAIKTAGHTHTLHVWPLGDLVALLRTQVRVARNIYGSFAEDFFTTLIM